MIRRLLPQVRLSDEAFHARHRVLRIILWLQFPLLGAMILLNLNGHQDRATTESAQATGGRWPIWAMTALLVGCALASLVARGRRLAAAVVSLGLLLSAALLISIGGGRMELQLGYFLALGLISLYQDWLPLLMSVFLVTAQSLALGRLAPEKIYSDAYAQANPVRFTLLHTGFVIGTCAIQITYWRFVEKAERQTAQVRTEGEQALRRTAERFEALVQDSSDVILVLDDSGRITSASTAATRIMGYGPDELIGMRHHLLIHPDDTAALQDCQGPAEVRVRHADGSWQWHDVITRDLSDHQAVRGLVVNHRDASDRRAFQERLIYEASHDALTSLVNRAELLRILERQLVRAVVEGSGVAVLYLDLNGFKQVNDRYGHDAGDRLLIAAAAGLRRSVFGSDTVGRLGGDEFAVVLGNVQSAADAVTVAKRVLAELSQPVVIEDAVMHPRASIGIALAEPGDTDTDTLLHRADTAMYHAKRDNTTGWHVYSDGTSGRTVQIRGTRPRD